MSVVRASVDEELFLQQEVRANIKCGQEDIKDSENCCLHELIWFYMVGDGGCCRRQAREQEESQEERSHGGGSQIQTECYTLVDSSFSAGLKTLIL